MNDQAPRPPKFPLNFLRYFLKNEYLEEIEGDLEEIFLESIEENSLKASKRNYAWEVLKLIHPMMVKNPWLHFNNNHNVMFKNYIKIGWRNILKYKGYSAINILGLSVGIATALTLLLIIDYEHSYDRDIPEMNQVYRVADEVGNDKLYDVIVTPALPLLVEEIPEIVSGTRFFNYTNDYVRAKDEHFNAQFHLVDPAFAETFQLSTLDGDLTTALSTPGSAALSASFARKLFNDEDPVGQILTFENTGHTLTVRAVVQDRPDNSNIPFEILVPWAHQPDWLKQAGNWYNTFMTAYVKLTPGTKLTDIADKLEEFKKKHYREDRIATHKITLLPLAKEHGRQADNGLLLNVLAIIAGCILIISCINFINLSTTQSLSRAREIGIRKVLGSLRLHLITQFLTESLIISGLSMGLGLAMLYLVIPKVNTFFELDITLGSFSAATVTTTIIVAILMTGVFSGLYPALFISRISTLQSLKNKLRSSGSGSLFQKILLSFQFGSSILLIAGTLLIGKQINYMKSTDLSFDGHETIGLSGSSRLFKDAESSTRMVKRFMTELKDSPLVKNVSSAQAYPGVYPQNYNLFNPTSEDGPANDGIRLRQITIDDQYFETLGIAIDLGENFSATSTTQAMKVIINTTAMKALGWTSIEGKYLSPNGSDNDRKYTVIGVTEDYYYQSLEMSIEPVAHFYSESPMQNMLVTFQEGKVVEGVKMVENKWEALDTYEAINFSFLDDTFDALYKSHERLGTTVKVFSLLAVIIAGLGLFSIASFSIKMKQKEVGVRKVLGASVRQLVLLLSSGYLGLVVISVLIVTPIFYFGSERFLSDFAHPINIDLTIILTAGVGVLVVAAICISIEAIKTSTSNPVNYLRDE